MPYIVYSCEKLSTENPLVWLGVIPTKLTIKNPHERLIQKPPWKIDYELLQKIGRKKRLTRMEKITQAESQKVKQISMVLAIIDEFGPINTTNIKEKSGLSWDSVTRTLKLLQKKKIVKLTRTKQNKNNEKIYSLRRERAIVYHQNLLFHKFPIIGQKQLHKIPNFIQRWQMIRKLLPQGWENWNIKTKHGEKIMKELHYIKLLMFNYVTGLYCYDCFEEGYVEKLKHTTDGSAFCIRKGHEFSEEEYQIRKVGTKWRKFQVDKEIHKIKKKYEKN